LKLKLAEASDVGADTSSVPVGVDTSSVSVGVDTSSVPLPPQPTRYNDRVINKIPLVFIITPIYNSI
jgi:hypothetical protein